MRKQLDDWLDTYWTNKMYDNFVYRRLDDTCDWILSRPEFLRWRSPEATHASLLWVNGPPGYGKTILCARMIQHLSSTAKSPLAYFFFSSDLERRADPFVVMRSWISQIVKQSEQAFDLALEIWEVADGRTASHTDIEQLFKTIIRAVPGCTFIVDGLDECAGVDNDWKADHRETITGFLQSLRRAVSVDTSRVLIVSRNTQEIREGLRAEETDMDSEMVELQILPEYVRADATLFSRNIVDNKLANKSEEQREKLTHKMVDRCESMFLGIKMLEGDLSGGKNLKQLHRIIDQTPNGIEHIYDRNWERITRLRESSRRRAFSILRWAAFSLRPITVLEITGALLLADEDCDEPDYDELPDSIDEVYIKSEILDLCGSLVEARGTESSVGLDSLTIHLAHFSVRQYILCHMLSSAGQLIANERLRSLNEAVENNILAKTCLRYLDSRRVWEETQVQEMNNPMAQAFRDEYASDLWYKHVKSSAANSGEITKLINAFFRPENERWEQWRRHFDTALQESMIEYECATTPGNPLFHSSLLGFLATMRYLVEEIGLDVNHADGSNRTALFAASSKGWVPGVSYLLQKGADVDIPNKKKRTPSYVAAYNGHIDVVKLLFEKGADLTAADTDGFTPLHAASSEGRVEVVDFLLEKNVDLLIEKDGDCTLLYLASKYGHVQIVQRLLKRGANPTALSQHGSTPLYAASKRGQFAVVQLLLDSGAKMMATKYEGWTPLHLASHYGHTDIVDLLLKKEDVSMAPLHGDWTPLLMASKNGHTQIVKLLLENGADSTVPGSNQWTPLTAALANGHAEVVKLLLAFGADPTARCDDNWPPLLLASNNGHTEIVKALLEYGADVQVPEGADMVPLDRASAFGHIEVVKVLLGSGADLTVRNGEGWTPLDSALMGGHTEVCRLLLENGADFVTPRNGWVPLGLASRKGNTEAVKLLLERGADVTALSSGWTPLMLACDKGELEVVELLLERGADLITPSCGWTPLAFACARGKPEIIELLLKNGADPAALSARWKPLAAACDITIRGHPEKATVLLEKGTDLIVR